MDFNENLKSIRCGAGITQKSLGEMIGVTSVTIGNWERGVRQPSFELLPKLADALDTSIDALLGKSRQGRQNKVEEELLRSFRKLDAHGQKLVRIVCNTELERVQPRKPEIIRFPSAVREDLAVKKHNRYIPFYYTPPAAGIAVPLETDEFEMLLADDSVPADADYAVRISGDSMEPYLKDGELVFVKETQELHNGDVGIFCVDGAMYCKQYFVDEDRNLHLLSANHKRINANIYIDGESGSSVKCCGRVLIGKTIPLPEYFDGN